MFFFSRSLLFSLALVIKVISATFDTLQSIFTFVLLGWLWRHDSKVRLIKLHCVHFIFFEVVLYSHKLHNVIANTH